MSSPLRASFFSPFHEKSKANQKQKNKKPCLLDNCSGLSTEQKELNGHGALGTICGSENQFLQVLSLPAPVSS